jgi:hypothetical protein
MQNRHVDAFPLLSFLEVALALAITFHRYLIEHQKTLAIDPIVFKYHSEMFFFF